MNKKSKIIRSVTIIIAILAFCVFAYEKVTNKEDPVISENIIQEETKIEENIVENEVIEENIIENTVEKTIEENIIPSETVTTLPEPTTVYQSQEVYESNSDIGTTDKKEQAIELVKQTWGEDSTVTFTCDSVTTEGEYIIAVTSLETATVKNYFRVNLKNKTVNVEY